MGFNISNLAAKLQENIADYTKIYALKLSNGFNAKSDPLFTVLPIVDKVPLIREMTTPILQPGRKGTTNFSSGEHDLKNREGVLKPFKADLKLTELQLYGYSKTYLAKKSPTDPNDVYSAPAMDHYMNAIMRQAGKDVHSALYKGVLNSAGTGAVDIADGLEIKLLQGIATSGTGFVGDIPVANQTTAAATINQANILSQINDLVLVIISNLDNALEEDGCLCIDPILYVHLINALNASLSNGSQVVYRDGAELRLAALPNTVVRPKSWLKSTGKLLWTVNGNFFFLTPESTSDVPSIQVEKADRSIKIFMDGEIGFDYADGRMIFMNSK